MEKNQIVVTFPTEELKNKAIEALSTPQEGFREDDGLTREQFATKKIGKFIKDALGRHITNEETTKVRQEVGEYINKIDIV